MENDVNGFKIIKAEGNEPRFDIDVQRGEGAVNEYMEFLAGLIEGKYEIKTDYRALETGNFYIETHSYDEYGEYASGISVTQSKYWGEALPDNGGFLVIPTSLLRELIIDAPEVAQPIYNQHTKASRGRLVKITDVMAAMFRIPR